MCNCNQNQNHHEVISYGILFKPCENKKSQEQIDREYAEKRKLYLKMIAEAKAKFALEELNSGKDAS